jgi:hypothetical protein
MKLVARLAFVIPALVLAGPASAEDVARGSRVVPPAPSAHVASIRYRALDRMLRTFAAKAAQQHAARKIERPTLIAQR